MSNLAIIPARGGSKRIPQKNIKDFLGKPIIAYSIEKALDSGLFSEVMVSTDDELIAEIAVRYGAKVPFLRSADNSTDYATTVDVLKEVVSEYHSMKQSFDCVCCIYPTAPLMKVQDLKKGYELLVEESLDSVFPIAAFSYPIWRGVEIVGGKTKMLWSEFQGSRSQDLKPVYHDAGQWYWFLPSKITDVLFTSNTSSIIIEEECVQDIDTITDWKLAEMKFKLYGQ